MPEPEMNRAMRRKNKNKKKREAGGAAGHPPAPRGTQSAPTLKPRGRVGGGPRRNSAASRFRGK